MSPKEKDLELTDVKIYDDDDREHDVDQMMDDVENSKNAKSDGGSSEALTMKEKYPPSFFTDTEGNLKYVNTVVQRPCCMFSVTLLVTVLISFFHFAMIGRGGNPFTEPTGQYDIKDKRSIAFDSVRLANEEVTQDRNDFLFKSFGRDSLRTQEGSNGVTLWIFESETEDGLFSTQKSISDMREAVTIFTQQDNYTQYCMRDYCEGENNLSRECLAAKEANNGVAVPVCRLPVTAMNMYYASEWDATMAQFIIDLFKVEGNIERYNALGLCVENDEKEDKCESLTNTTYDTEEDRAWAKETNDIMTDIINKWDGSREDTPSIEEINQITEFAAYMMELETKRGTVDYFFDKDFSVDNQESQYSRATILWGSPPDVNITVKEDDKKKREEMTQEEIKEEEEQLNRDAVKDYVLDNILDKMKKLAETDNSDETNSYYFMPALFFDIFIQILLRDGLLAIFSFVFVFVWIRICVGSWFLAFVGFLEIVLSVPLSWFIYSSIFRIQYFAGLNVLALYIVAAIGADDIFIFMDAYKQSAYLKEDEHPGVLNNLQSRMSWVYRRTGSAMAITSATTCAAFLCTLITPIADVQSFGIFAAIVIFIDYALVMTLFCTAVVVYHNKFEKPGCCCACDCRNTDPTPTEQAKANEDSLDESKVTVFFRDRVAGFISKPMNRLFIGLGFVAWIAVAITFGSQIKPVEKEEQFLSEDHPLQKSVTILNEEFGNAENDIGLQVHFAWGVDNVDQEGVRQLFDPEYLGKSDFDENFEFNEECQTELLNQCDYLKQNKDLAPYIKQKGGQGAVKCFVEEFAAFSALGSLEDCDAVLKGDWKNSTWQVNAAELQSKMFSFSLQSSCYSDEGESIFQFYSKEMGFNGTDVKYATIAVENPVLDPFTQKSEGFVREQYDKMIEVSEELHATVGPACNAKQVIMTDLDQKFIFMNNQRIYVRSAISSAAVGIVIAFSVLLISTRVFHIASLATLSIMGVLVSVVACLVMAGWDLGTTESILISIIAGFSVDYVVHLAHAYKVASGSTQNRIQTAFGTMGISVLNGMITSVGASIPLFFCEIQFFLKFGTFLFLTIGFSWLFANFGFMSVLAQLGLPIHKNRKCNL